MRRLRGLLAACLAGGLANAAWGDDLDRAAAYRNQVNAAIDVLVATKATPSSACLSALDDMHTTERQLKELTGQAGEGGSPAVIASQSSEIGIARDVLASDLQQAAGACRADAVRVCSADSGRGAAQCGKVRQAGRVP
jgi:hypothetical protein